MKSITIPCMFSSMNVWIDKNRIMRGGWNAGNALKQRDQKVIAGFLDKQLKGQLEEPVFIEFTYFCHDGRTDPDNLAGYFHKIFLDTLVTTGRLKNDSFKNVLGFCDRFHIDKNNVRIEIVIHEGMDKE